MIDEFLEWFRNGLRNLGCLLFDTLEQSLKMFGNVLTWLIRIALIILISPIWILPFIYWWLFVRNKRGGSV